MILIGFNYNVIANLFYNYSNSVTFPSSHLVTSVQRKLPFLHYDCVCFKESVYQGGRRIEEVYLLV